MKYITLIFGMLLVAGSLITFVMYGDKVHGMAFVLTGFVGTGLIFWSTEQHSKDFLRK